MAETPNTQPEKSPLTLIEEAYQRRDASAVRHQGRRVSFARFAVILGPLAVFALSLQVIAYSKGGTEGKILIGCELAALLVALLLGYFEIGQSHYRWIRERIRAELIRRDQFLLTARAGPYLSIQPSHLVERVRNRLREIDSELEDPIALLMQELDERDWRFALEDVDAQESLPIESLEKALEHYSGERVDAQRIWFEEKSEEHDRFANRLEQLSRFALVLATALASTHFYLLSIDEHHAFVSVAALTLPAVAAAIVAVQCVFGSRHLSRSYGLAARSLSQVASRLDELRADAQSGTKTSADELQFRFKRIVLEVERIIADDLRRWWLTVYPEAPRAGA